MNTTKDLPVVGGGGNSYGRQKTLLPFTRSGGKPSKEEDRSMKGKGGKGRIVKWLKKKIKLIMP